jgi:hypothetical protein
MTLTQGPECPAADRKPVVQLGGNARARTQPMLPPRDPPPFTFADVRAAIPKHCFERSALRSFAHLFKVRRSATVWLCGTAPS